MLKSQVTLQMKDLLNYEVFEKCVVEIKAKTLNFSS